MEATVALKQGSVPHTVLLYTVSEPGDWTAQSIAEDLPGLGAAAVQRAARQLSMAGLIHINSADHRLWPSRAARAVIPS